MRGREGARECGAWEGERQRKGKQVGSGGTRRREDDTSEGGGKGEGGRGGAREKDVWSRGRLRDSAGEREGKTLGDESILRTKS